MYLGPDTKLNLNSATCSNLKMLKADIQIKLDLNKSHDLVTEWIYFSLHVTYSTHRRRLDLKVNH